MKEFIQVVDFKTIGNEEVRQEAIQTVVLAKYRVKCEKRLFFCENTV